MATINWYPGHMAKSRRMLIEQLRAVDAVVELVDARAPLSSANPDLRGLTRGKARLLVLNKACLLYTSGRSHAGKFLFQMHCIHSMPSCASPQMWKPKRM